MNNFIVDILPIEYNMMPDSVITVDIHIQKITAVDEIKSDPVTLLQISPNPIILLILYSTIIKQSI